MLGAFTKPRRAGAIRQGLKIDHAYRGDGDAINLQVYNGLYATAVSGGGGQIQTKQRTPGCNESLTTVKLNGGGHRRPETKLPFGLKMVIAPRYSQMELLMPGDDHWHRSNTQS